MAQRSPRSLTGPGRLPWPELADLILCEIYEDRYALYEEGDFFGLYWHDFFS